MMAIQLFEHNRAAYSSALAMLRSSRKAVIIHPTGTGKSFIGFTLAEEHPNNRVLWLSPSEYIVRTQLENLKRESGVELNNIIFVTYVRLMLMTGAEISELRPDWIIMDEYHRCGAERWSDGVANLLSAYPNCPTLGLSATNIRYLDGQRDMAAELFDGNVASEMTLGEAIVRGILLKPKYVVALYDYEDELNNYQKRINSTKNIELRNANQRKLDALRRSLDNADGIDEILYKHITDKRGKYIVFCSSVEDVVTLKKLARRWFWKIDDEPHVYSVYSYFDESGGEFDAFKADGSDHIKLLYCVDMLNEGVHVDNISGVILCRLTVSPTVYKQQIGRALSAGKTNDAVIFDFVNNFKNLYSVSSLVDEVAEAVAFYRDNGMPGYIVNDSFTVTDEVRDSVELFNDLEDTLSVSWNNYYNIARKYYEEHKNLDVPISYKTADGVALGQWLNMQRKIRRGTVIGLLTPARIKMLDSIGMRWERGAELRWNMFYSHAVEYYNEHRNLEVKTKYISSDGYPLGETVSVLRRLYKKPHGGRGMLTDGHIEALNKMGMLWEARGKRAKKPEKNTNKTDAAWLEHFADAKKFYEENGHSNVDYQYKTETGFKLGIWLYEQRKKHAAGELSDEKTELLNAVGFDWKSSNVTWEKRFAAAKKYYEENGDLRINVSDARLGAWLQEQRKLKKEGALSEPKIRRLTEIGMEWLTRNDAQWERGFECAKEYYEKNGNLKAPKSYRSEDGFLLNQWLKKQRENKAAGLLDAEQVKRLESIGMEWLSPRDAAWEKGFAEAEKYFADHKNLDITKDYECENGYKLGDWLTRQKSSYKAGTLYAERVKRLEAIGVRWQPEHEARWERGFESARQYYSDNANLNVPRQYQCADGYNLGFWVMKQRNNRRNGRLAEEKVKRLDSIGMVWGRG